MSISKLNFNSASLIDLTDTSVDSSTLYQTYTAHSSIGNPVLGAAASNFPVENALVDGSFSGVYINNRVKTLGVSAFRHLTSITKAILPEVTTAGDYVFDGCTALESVELPKLTTIGIQQFLNDSNLVTVNAELITYVGPSAFQGCSKLQNFNSSNIIGLGQSAFQNCTALTSAIFPKTTMFSTSYPNQGGAGSSVFSGCSGLSIIDFPKLQNGGSGGYQFLNCTNLTSAKILATGTHMFQGCTKLQNAVLYGPGNMNSYAFNGDTSLTVLDTTTPSTGTYELNNCSQVSALILRNPRLVTLKDINVFNGTPFASGGSGGTIYVPQDLLESYPSATNWSTILGYENNNITAIESSQYENYYADGSKTIYCDDVTSSGSAKGSWDYEWTYQDGLISANGWTKEAQSAYCTETLVSDGVQLSSGSGVSLILTKSDFCPSRGLLEITLYLTQLSTSWNTRISLRGDTKGIELYQSGGYWRILNSTSLGSGTSTGVAATVNTPYTIRLMTTENDIAYVWINNKLTNIFAQWSSLYATATTIRSQHQNGCVIQSIKYKSFD